MIWWAQTHVINFNEEKPEVSRLVAQPNLDVAAHFGSPVSQQPCHCVNYCTNILCHVKPSHPDIHYFSGIFGLWLDEDLLSGTTQPCETFDNGVLSHESHFKVFGIELWGFHDDTWVWICFILSWMTTLVYAGSLIFRAREIERMFADIAYNYCWAGYFSLLMGFIHISSYH